MGIPLIYNVSMGFEKLRELSVFFPLYNEENNVTPLVEHALSVLPLYAERFEIILINDGSTDRTKEIAEALAALHLEVQVITQENKGYGGALSAGFNSALYEWIFFSDGDLQFDLNDLEQFVSWADTYNLIIGHRKRRADGKLRVFIAMGLKIWNRIFFGFPTRIKDIDCAFKLINRKVLDDVLPLASAGGMVSTEFLLKAIGKGHLIKQLPVEHFERESGSSTGDSVKVVKKAVLETWQLLKTFPKRLRKLQLILLPVLLFLVLLPVSLNIGFMQNDDYTHYRMVEQFLTGNFILDPYLGATFYLQGLLGTGFAYLFGISNFPVLTLLVSILGFYVFLRILNDFLKLSFDTTVLLGLLYFFNPLFLYSIWGFMTENYFMLFFLLSVYYILKFIRDQSSNAFYMANGFIILSYFVRQFAFVTSAAFGVYLLFKKKYAWAFLQFLFLAGLLYYHYNYFPITPQMYDGGLGLATLLNIDRTISLATVIGIYLSIFTIPLILGYFLNADVLRSPKKYLVMLFIPLLILIVGNFEPKKIDFTARFRSGKVVTQFSKVEFPYLENVFGRKGFLEDNFGGNKYHYPGFFDLFNVLEIVGLIGLTLLIVILVSNSSYLFSFSSIYIAGFILLLLIAPKLFDRYLLALVPMTIVLLAAILERFEGLQKMIVVGYVFFLAVMGYQYSADFISTNNYAWKRAEELSRDLVIPRKYFNVNHSWRSLYPIEARGWYYYFEYAESKRASSEKFFELESYNVSYPFNFYLEPEIKLFYRKSAFDN